MKNKKNKKRFWEVYVPYHSNDGVKFELAYHRLWDEKVRVIAGGLTIFKISKGQWVKGNEIYFDKMIPVRIHCTKKDIKKIVDITMIHYNQLAVFYFKVSNYARVVKRKDNGIQETK